MKKLLFLLIWLSPLIHAQHHDPKAIGSAEEAMQSGVEAAQADPTRPVYHFMPPARWMNDPNGAFYQDGWYHVFYQFNPYGNTWGHMHWGHARSRDNVHWEHLPVAVWPGTESGEDHCYSGSAVMYGTGNWQLWYTSVSEVREKDHDKGPLDFVFNGQVMLKPMDPEFIKWGKTTEDPVGAPTLPNNMDGLPWNAYIRDPSFFQAGKKTFMLLGSTGKDAPIYQATNKTLTGWEYRGIMSPHGWDCPQMIPVGDRWIYILSKGAPPRYLVGTFDPGTASFTEETGGVLDQGGAHYHTVSFSTDDRGRQILYSWITGILHAKGWNNCFALPRIISLGEDSHPIQQPVPELTSLRGEYFSLKWVTGSQVLDTGGDAIEIHAVFENAGEAVCGLRVRRSDDGRRAIGIRYENGQLQVAGISVKINPEVDMDQLDLRIFLDKSILEIFVNWGRLTITKVIYPPEKDLGIEIFSEREASVDVWQMKRITKK